VDRGLVAIGFLGTLALALVVVVALAAGPLTALYVALILLYALVVAVDLGRLDDSRR